VAIAIIDKGIVLAKRALGLQSLVALLTAIICLPFFSFPIVLNYAAGAAISILPNLVFTFYAFRYSGASKRHLVVKSMSQGSKLKMACTIILFVMAFTHLPDAPVALILGFVITTATHTIAVMWSSAKE
jgi:ATP synthase protein I